MNINRNDERILVKYVDENFNIYKCVINNSDNFVINFCKRNLEKMEKILKNGEIVEMNGHFLLKVEDPILRKTYGLPSDDQSHLPVALR